MIQCASLQDEKATKSCQWVWCQQQLNIATFWSLWWGSHCCAHLFIYFYSFIQLFIYFSNNLDRWSIDFLHLISVSLNEICLLTPESYNYCSIRTWLIKRKKKKKKHEKEGCCLGLIAVDTFMQCTESLSLSALIMWPNQCLLGWERLARPQWRLDDEGTNLQSVRGPPTCLSRHVAVAEFEGSSDCMFKEALWRFCVVPSVVVS